MRRIQALALGGLLLSAMLSPVAAQPDLPPPAREPMAEYALLPQHGPYLIYIASFRGEEAYDLAHRLAKELREEYRLSAYIFRRVDQDAEAERQRILQIQRERFGEEVASRRRIVRVPDEYAVMVGDYKDLESAKYSIGKLRQLQRPSSLGLFGVVVWERKREEINPKIKKLGENRGNPFVHAFPTVNPLVRQRQQQAGINPFHEMDWKEINKKEQYSLMSCPQPYTLMFKEYRSKEASKFRPKQDAFDPTRNDNRQPKFFGRRGAFTFLPPIMDQADDALKAAEALRGKGFQAYVLHLGETSYVTVGGFSGLKDPTLGQTWAALKQQYGKEAFLQSALPTLMPVPGRNAPPLGEPVK